MEISLEHNHLSDLLQLGHVFVLVAPHGNDEKLDYWLACCVRGKQKFSQPITDDDGSIYPVGSMVIMKHGYRHTCLEGMEFIRSKTIRSRK